MGQKSSLFVNQTQPRLNYISLLGLFAFLTQIPYFYGEDIVNARNNYLVGSRTDFWGGASTLVYSFIPSFGIRWQIWLALVQVIFTCTGLIMLLDIRFVSKKSLCIRLLLSYSAIMFGIQMTRDGLLFSLLILGFGIFRMRRVTWGTCYPPVLACFLISFAMGFRPWMTLAILPLVIFYLHGYKGKLNILATGLAILGILLLPIFINFGATKILALKESYPQQQVMMMDLAATYCYSNNESTIAKAQKGLKNFTNDEEYFEKICDIYRPDTWESLTMAGHAASNGLVTDFGLIMPFDSESYENLKVQWIGTIVSDPISYIQNKILFMGKLSIGSDSRNLSILSPSTLQGKIASVYRLPYEIFISLHFYSIACAAFLILLLPLVRLFRDQTKDLRISRVSLVIIFSLILWNLLSAVAYIGSNGRYTYTISMLGLILYVSSLGSEVHKYDEK